MVEVSHSKTKDQRLSDEAKILAMIEGSDNFLTLYGAFWEHSHGLYHFNLVIELVKESLSAKIKSWETIKWDSPYMSVETAKMLVKRTREN